MKWKGLNANRVIIFFETFDKNLRMNRNRQSEELNQKQLKFQGSFSNPITFLRLVSVGCKKFIVGDTKMHSTGS